MVKEYLDGWEVADKIITSTIRGECSLILMSPPMLVVEAHCMKYSVKTEGRPQEITDVFLCCVIYVV